MKFGTFCLFLWSKENTPKIFEPEYNKVNKNNTGRTHEYVLCSSTTLITLEWKKKKNMQKRNKWELEIANN